MAKEKLVKNITSRDEDFAQWYTDVVRERSALKSGKSSRSAAAGLSLRLRKTSRRSSVKLVMKPQPQHSPDQDISIV